MICSLRFGQICLSKQVELGNEETHIVRLDRFTWKNGEEFAGAATATVGFQGSDHARSSNRIICKGRLARANSAGAAGDEELERGRCNQRKAAYLRQRGRGIEGDEASAGSPWFLDPEHAPVCIAVCRQGRACKAFVVSVAVL